MRINTLKLREFQLKNKKLFIEKINCIIIIDHLNLKKITNIGDVSIKCIETV